MPDTLHPFEAELTRLLDTGLTPEQEVIARRYYSDTERESMDEDSFCGPNRTYPITSEADVSNAAHLIGKAENPDTVKSCIIRKAKANGWALPDAWKEDDSADRAADAQPLTPDAPIEESEQPIERTAMPEHASMYAPIVRIDKNKREVEGVATSEAVDSYGTIFSYEASKKAFQRWMERTANVREMHQKKAVGRGIGVRFDDAGKKIYVNTYVSRSADGENAWTKLEEGILGGYSVGADAHSAVWDTVTRNGKKYPYLVSYDLAELSLVDNASNPDAHGLLIARSDGLTEIVDTSDTADSAPLTPDSSAGTSSLSAVTSTTGGVVERAGARVGSGTRAGMHESIGHTLQSVKSQMKNCSENCPDCTAALKQLDPDDDGDIDIFGGAYGDTDGDAATHAHDAERAVEPAITQATLDTLIAHIDRAYAPYMQRSSAIMARMAGMPEPEPTISQELIRSAVSAELSSHISPTLTEVASLKETLNTALERIERLTSQSEVRSVLTEVKETVERIAAQPQGGGPVLNGGGYPVDKRLATQSPMQQNTNAMTPEVKRAFWDDLQRRGLLNTLELQQAAAADNIQRMPGRMGL